MEKRQKGDLKVKVLMNKYIKIGTILIILIMVIIISYYLAAQNFSLLARNPIFEQRRIPINEFFEIRYLSYLGDIELFYITQTILSSINATLLIFLLVTYITLYSRIKSEFTIGLILFSLILLLYALSSNPVLQQLFGFRAFGLGPFAMLPDLFTTIALAILFYLSMK